MKEIIRNWFRGSFLEKMIIIEVKEELGSKLILNSTLFKEDISEVVFLIGYDLLNLKYIPFKKISKWVKK